MSTSSNLSDSDVPEAGLAGLDSRSLSSSVRRGALWVVASNALLRVTNVLLTAVIAHILSPHDFGVFAVALTAYTIVASLGELGVSACLIRADLDIENLAPTVATVSVVSCTLLAGVMAAFAGPIATALGSAAATGPVRVMSLAVLLPGVFAVPNSHLARDFRQDKIFLANIIGFVPSTALLIVMAESGAGAMSLVWSSVVRQFIIGCVLIAAAPKRYRPGFARSALSVILKFGLPLAGANFVSYLLLNVDYAFVGHLMGATALGIYVLAFTVASWPYGLLGAVINSISMPAFSRIKHDPGLMKDAIATALRGVSLLVLPMCAMSVALAHPIILTLYGPKWGAAANVLVVLSLYGAVSMTCLLLANILTSVGWTKVLLVLQMVWIGTLIPAMMLGVHKDGIIGAAYAHVAVIVPIVLPSYLLAVKRATGVRLLALGKAPVPALLASSAAALAAHAVAFQLHSPPTQLIAGLAAGGVVYVICAGHQVVAVLGQGRATERILRIYSVAARLARWPSGGRRTPLATYPAKGTAPACEDIGEASGNVLLGQGREPNGTPEGLVAPISRAEPAHADRREACSADMVAVHQRIAADQERLLGPDHPHTLASRANLAYAYCRVGWLAEAIPLYERTLAGRRRQLGPDHPATLRSSNYLASAYHDIGRLAEAIPLYERTLALCTHALGDDHTFTRTVRRRLGIAQELAASQQRHPRRAGTHKPERDQRDAETADSGR